MNHTIVDMEEQQCAVGGRPTEEEMLEILSNKYEFHPKGTPYAAKQVGASEPSISTNSLRSENSLKRR